MCDHFGTALLVYIGTESGFDTIGPRLDLELLALRTEQL
jgi:hypothetical protein